MWKVWKIAQSKSESHGLWRCFWPGVRKHNRHTPEEMEDRDEEREKEIYRKSSHLEVIAREEEMKSEGKKMGSYGLAKREQEIEAGRET